MLIYCFLVFQHILYYQSQADAAKVPFIWVVLLSELHTVTHLQKSEHNLWWVFLICLLFFCGVPPPPFLLADVPGTYFGRGKKSFQNRQAICRNGNQLLRQE